MFNGAGGRREEYYEDENIVEEGEEGDDMFVVVSGNAVVEKDGRSVTSYGARDFFGERVLVSGGVRGATVRADGPCECLRLSRGPVEDLIARFEHVKQAFDERARVYAEQDYAATESPRQPPETFQQPEASEAAVAPATLERTRLPKTVMARLIEAVTTVSKSTVRATELRATETAHGVLVGEHEALQGSHAALQARLAAAASAEASAVAARDASATAVSKVTEEHRLHMAAAARARVQAEQGLCTAFATELQSTKAVLGSENTRLRSEVVAASSRLEELDRVRGQLQAKAVAHDDALAQHKATQEELSAATAALSAEQGAAEAARTCHREEIDRLSAALASSTAAAAELSSENSQLQAQAAAHDGIMSALEGKIAELIQAQEETGEAARQHVRRTEAKLGAVHCLQKLTSSMDASEIFQQFDADADGTVSKEEMRLGLAQMGEELGEDELGELMELVDVDGDGSIDYTELVRLGQMQESLLKNEAELQRCSAEIGTMVETHRRELETKKEQEEQAVARQSELEASLSSLRTEHTAALEEGRTQRAQLEAAAAARQELEAELSRSTAAHEESQNAAREKLAAMFKTVETQHKGVAQLAQELSKAEAARRKAGEAVQGAEERAQQLREEAIGDAPHLLIGTCLLGLCC